MININVYNSCDELESWSWSSFSDLKDDWDNNRDMLALPELWCKVVWAFENAERIQAETFEDFLEYFHKKYNWEFDKTPN